MKTNIFIVALIVIAAAVVSCSGTRNIKMDAPTDSVSIRKMIDSQRFVFIPRYVNPLGGRRRELTSGFELSVSKDSLISYLPFLGRGYIAPISPSDVDFDFTSTNFTYAVTPGKRGWNISIKPKDQQYLQEIYFRIFDNGTASLNITSINRSSISYDGYLTRRL
jgi:hypothetical protein